MPPKKTTSTRKTSTRKPAAKKTTAKKSTARKPTAKRQYRRKKADKKLPIGFLFALIPMILLTAFVVLRFSGGNPPAPTPTPAKSEVTTAAPKKEVIEVVEKKNVPDAVKLFLFEKNIKNSNLHINGASMLISARSEAEAVRLTKSLKGYLSHNQITVDGDEVLTAEDTDSIYNISFDYPKPAPKSKKKKLVKKQPEATAVNFKAKMAVVIDDCGYNMGLARELASVDYPVTFAVIPFTPYGKQTAILARKSGKTVFIHFPMQPKSYPKFDPGKGALFLNMPETLINAVTNANFEYFPVKLDGANNHTGSAFTENAEKMSQALKAIKSHTDTFLDSHTSGRSVAYEVCQDSGMKCGVNNVFLDNEEPGLVTISDKKNHVHNQLMVAAKRALKNGSAIAIGHLRKGTVSALNSSFANIKKMGVQIVPVKELMN